MLQDLDNDFNLSVMTVLGRQFVIEPEYLIDEEIKYELNIRGYGSQGDRRTLAGQLRRYIADENRNPGARRIYNVGNPTDEFEYVSRNVERLTQLLGLVTADPTSHDRFMSLLIHLRGRLNRIIPPPDLDLSQVVYSVNAEIAEVYGEFVTQLTNIMSRSRQRVCHQGNRNEQSNFQGIRNNIRGRGERPSSTPAQFSAIGEVSNEDTNVTNSLSMGRNEQLATNRASNPDIEHITIQSSVENSRITTTDESNTNNNTTNHGEATNNNGSTNHNNANRGQFEANASNGNVPSITIRSPSATNNGEITNEQSNDDGQQANATFRPSQIYRDPYRSTIQFLDGMMRRLERVSLGTHATLHGDDQYRHSQRFNRTTEGIITPIPDNFPSRSSMPSMNPNLSQVSNRDRDFNSVSQRVNNLCLRESLGNNAFNNDSQYLGRMPNQSFGADRVNTLPERFGEQRNANMNDSQVRRNNNVETSVENDTIRPNDTSDNSLAQKVDSILRAMTSLTENMVEMSQWRQSLNENNHPSRVSTEPRPQYSNASYPNMFSIGNTFPSASLMQNPSTSMYRPSQFSDQMSNGRNFSSMYNNQVERNANRVQASNVPIHKWTWKFSADKNAKGPEQRDLAAFLKKLELYRESENLTYDQIHKKFHYLIDGCVYEWYMQYRDQFANWEQLREGLVKQFTTPLTHFMKVAKLAARRQGKDESAMSYIASVQREFDAMEIYSEQEKISVIRNGLNDRLRDIAMSSQWQSVQELDLHLRSVEVADELHKETEAKTFRRQFFPKRSVNAIENDTSGFESIIEDEDDNEKDDGNKVLECDAFKAKSNFKRNNRQFDKNMVSEKTSMPNSEVKEAMSRRVYKCYNCKSEEHLLHECDQPIERVFCFKCGAEGMTANKCDHESLKLAKNE